MDSLYPGRSFYLENQKMNGIKVYDNVFTRSDAQLFYAFITNSSFKIGWHDNPIIENRGTQFMHSKWSTEDVEKVGLLKKITNKDLLRKINGRVPHEIVVNCSKFGEVYAPHTHDLKPDVLLYYANLEWKREWYGETLFYSEDLKDIIHANPYVPGRIVWFRGEIPHSIRPSSYTAPQYRFTISFFFLNDKTR